MFRLHVGKFVFVPLEKLVEKKGKKEMEVVPGLIVIPGRRVVSVEAVEAWAKEQNLPLRYESMGG